MLSSFIDQLCVMDLVIMPLIVTITYLLLQGFVNPISQVESGEDGERPTKFEDLQNVCLQCSLLCISVLETSGCLFMIF